MMFAEAPPLVGNGMPPLANSDTPPSVAAGKRLNPLPVYSNPSFEREKSDLSSSGTNSTLGMLIFNSMTYWYMADIAFDMAICWIF